jgi:hypothetical protein
MRRNQEKSQINFPSHKFEKSEILKKRAKSFVYLFSSIEFPTGTASDDQKQGGA